MDPHTRQEMDLFEARLGHLSVGEPQEKPQAIESGAKDTVVSNTDGIIPSSTELDTYIQSSKKYDPENDTSSVAAQFVTSDSGPSSGASSPEPLLGSFDQVKDHVKEQEKSPAPPAATPLVDPFKDGSEQHSVSEFSEPPLNPDADLPEKYRRLQVEYDRMEKERNLFRAAENRGRQDLEEKVLRLQQEVQKLWEDNVSLTSDYRELINKYTMLQDQCCDLEQARAEAQQQANAYHNTILEAIAVLNSHVFP